MSKLFATCDTCGVMAELEEMQKVTVRPVYSFSPNDSSLYFCAQHKKPSEVMIAKSGAFEEAEIYIKVVEVQLNKKGKPIDEDWQKRIFQSPS